VKAKKALSKGQPITITYCSLLINTQNRLKTLKDSKFFICQCNLCQDPTEKGTFLSAILCPKCKEHLLPESFHLSDPVWKCNKCLFSSSNEKVTKLVDSIKNSFETIMSNPVSSSEKMAQLESMLKKRSGINLPSRHQILLNLKQELSNLYDSDPKLLQNGNIDNINKRLEFTKEKITILNILEGEETDSRFKGFLQFRLHNLLVAKIALLQRNKTLTNTEMNKIGGQLGETLKESARILYQDHGCPKELIEIITNISQINSETIKPA